MSFTTIILAGTLSILPGASVELTVDCARVTIGIDCRIEITLFDAKGQQKGKTQTITVGAAADVDAFIRCFQTAMNNTGLTATPVAGTTKVKITGPAADFRRIEYSTSTKQGDEWIPNAKIKGPTIVGKAGARSPTFAVNPKPL